MDKTTAQDNAQKLAEDHVDWLLEIMRPLLVEEFIHGYKHGQESKEAADA